MNELEQTLQKILERSLEVAEQTGQFAIEQAPEILEQFFAWHLAKHCLGCLLGLSFCIVGIIIIRLVRKTDWSFIDKGMVTGFGYILGLLVGFGMIIGNLYWVTFITVAPKIYLIEYFVR